MLLFTRDKHRFSRLKVAQKLLDHESTAARSVFTVTAAVIGSSIVRERDVLSAKTLICECTTPTITFMLTRNSIETSTCTAYIPGE